MGKFFFQKLNTQKKATVFSKKKLQLSQCFCSVTVTVSSPLRTRPVTVPYPSRHRPVPRRSKSTNVLRQAFLGVLNRP